MKGQRFMTSRAFNTRLYLAGKPGLFDRLTKDRTGGRVDFFNRMPKDYDNKLCLPWSEVRGRYWYPWM